jgi:hypothetical protein
VGVSLGDGLIVHVAETVLVADRVGESEKVGLGLLVSVMV